ncbi:FAD/NAD-binding domain-containing protein [Rickenella mellea]|uniref:FAD/NAD-binding domain-containing protein n=1 Tax=Rickenella mellea TaxID=50990 RepID=A0A4Y7Q1V9_9AGAM|nr:FAD/NAD-binding domain-containing protein [Rickenella mellea]
MSASIKPQVSLPTIERLGSKIPESLDAKAVASKWFTGFSEAIAAEDAHKVVDMVVEDAFWRDMLALTWEFRTFQGTPRILRFLTDRLSEAKLQALKLDEGTVELQKPFPDIAWIHAQFTFETAVGSGFGVFRLVLLGSGEWKAHTIYTNLEELKGFPERIGTLRDHLPNHGKWLDKRQREIDFEDTEPAVIVIGGGHSGLDIAARLKHLDVPTLVIEKNARIGDQWRKRYQSLCLHDPVGYDHMPYIPFPASWPVFTPAMKLADWLESFAHSMELNVWTGATIASIIQDENKVPLNGDQGPGAWTVTIKRSDGRERTFHPRHVVFALGFGSGVPNMPTYPGMDDFGGTMIHSSQYRSGRDNEGKKVVIIGACNSGHDIAQDNYHHGVDVTIFQRNSTYVLSTERGIPVLFAPYWEGSTPIAPTELADRLSASLPLHLLKIISQRITAYISELDRALLDGLHKVGFRTNTGEDGSGSFYLAHTRAGGYYVDVGASQLIIDGKIKLKNDSQISRFTPEGIEFDNGSTLRADVIIFATGYGDARDPVRTLCGDKIADLLLPVWGLNDEGELSSIGRWSGVPGLYFQVGNLAISRFTSKHLSLQIKAIEVGVFGTRYAARA